MKLKYIFWTLITFAFVSCADDEFAGRWEGDFELTYSHTFKIKLDSTTGGIPSGYNGTFTSNNPDDSIFPHNKTFFQFISQRGDWLVYDLETGKLVKKLPPRMPDETYEFGMLGAYLVVNSDSIYTLDYPFLTLINHEGELITRHLVKENGKIAQYIPTSDWRPIISETHVLSGFITENLPPRKRNQKVSMKELIGSTLYIDINSGKRSFHHQYPKEFIDVSYLSSHHYFATLENYADGQALLGFASSDSLYVIENKNIIKQFPANYSKFRPFANKGAREDDYDFYRTNYSYGAHFYDERNSLLYRIVQLPISEYELNNPIHSKANYKQVAVLVFDENQNKLAETILPKNFHDLMVFVHDGQIYFWDYEKTLSDEDYMYFGVFSLTSKDKI